MSEEEKPQPSTEEILLMCIPDDMLTSRGGKAKARIHAVQDTYSVGFLTPAIALRRLRPEFVK